MELSRCFAKYILPKLWGGSAYGNEQDKFNENENYLRIRDAYCNPVKQKITLYETSLSKEEHHEPIKFMTLEKKEFIRWLKDCKALPVPLAWFSS